MRRTSLFLACMIGLTPLPTVAADVADGVLQLTRGSKWVPAGEVAIQFPTFHPQGMVKIGDDFFVSSVEITKPTTKFAAPAGWLRPRHR